MEILRSPQPIFHAITQDGLGGLVLGPCAIPKLKAPAIGKFSRKTTVIKIEKYFRINSEFG